MTLDVRSLTGDDIKSVLPDLARLRMIVFRDWPYLYDGTLEYEEEYLAKFANETRQQRPEPKEIPVERGQTHNWYFIDSILNNKPSRENATEGHYAAAAAHLCNLAYRHKTRASWDPATGKVKL